MSDESKQKTTKGKFVKGDDYLVVQKITQPCEHKIDGAIEVAKYIVGEIKKNVKSNQASSMRYMNDYEGRLNEWKKLPLWQKMFTPVPKPMSIEAMAIWTERVASRRPWDHKVRIPDLFQKVAVTRMQYSHKQKKVIAYSKIYHKYKNYDYYYDIWSNIHYGYVGLSVGFSRELLLKGASTAQVIDSLGRNTEDPPDDVTAINIGFSLFRKFGIFAEKLTHEDILKEIHSQPDSGFPNSRKNHICLEKK